MRFKDTELKAVLASVEEDLKTAYEAAKDSLLVKADEEESPPEAAPAEASDSPAPEAPPAAAPEASSAPAAAPEASDSPAPEAAPAESPSQDPAEQQGEALTPEALQAEYSQLSPEELDMHIKAALSAKEALAASAAPAPEAPPAAAPEAPPAMPTEKGELKVDKKANGGVIKSETDPKVVVLESLVKSQAEDIENLTKAIKMVMERPERKAVTSVAYLSKAETPAAATKEFSPAEARQKLKDMIPDLNKSERALVLDFFEGRASAEKLAPILDKAK